MAVAIKSGQTGSAQSGSASTSISVSLPSAPTSGNLLVFCMAGDKNTGVLTLSGFTKLYELLSSSVSLYIYYKVSDGSETTINPSWASSSAAGNTCWYAELEDTAVSGSTWQVTAQASNITDETTVTSKATGTTGTKPNDGLGVAVATIDSSQSVTTVNAWGNSYNTRHSATGAGGRGGVFIADKAETSGGTTSSTFNYSGTADQVSAAIGVFTKVSGATHSVSVGQWRWYTDEATDGAMVPLANENTAPTIQSWMIQDGILRLRLQLSETGGAGGSGAVSVQYSGGGAYQTLEPQTPASGREGWWFRYANGKATDGGTVGSQLLSGSTVSGKYIETDGPTITVGANEKVECDVAVKVHWPPPGRTINFQILYAGSSIGTLSFVTGLRPFSVVALDGDSAQKTSREVRFTAWERIFWDDINDRWWCFTVQFNTPTVLRSYWWTRAGQWQAGPTMTFTDPGHQSRHAVTFRKLDTNTWVVYAHYGDSSSTRRFARGTITSSGLAWGSEQSLTQTSDRHRAVGVDDGGFVWIAGTTAATGLWVRRATSADSVSAWEAALSISDTAVASGDVLAVIGLASNRCLILWRPTGANTAIKYAICTSTTVVTTGNATATTTTNTEDWGVTRKGGFVYLLHSDSESAGGNWVLRVFDETGETWATGTSPAVSGQVTSHDGIALTAHGDDLFAFGTFLGSGGGQDRIIRYKRYTGPGASGSWGTLTTLTDAGGRGNSDHVAAPRQSGDGQIVVLSAFNDDDVTSNARTLEFWPLTPDRTSETTPLRGIFYYPWFTGGNPTFPGAWDQGDPPFTQFHPNRGYYECDDDTLVDGHIGDILYGLCDFAIASWWGPGSREDGVAPRLFNRSLGTALKWCMYHEAEGNTVGIDKSEQSPDPSAHAIASDLNHIWSFYAHHPNYLWVGGNPVVFVYGDAGDGTQAASERPTQRWADGVAAAAHAFFYVLKVWSGYTGETPQPDGWHQYGPSSAVDRQAGFSETLSPGYWFAQSAAALLDRLSDATWRSNITTMIGHGDPFQLITSFNEWGEGHSVESADGNSGRDYTGSGWSTGSGRGLYLDGLNNPEGADVLSSAGGIARPTRLLPTNP